MLWGSGAPARLAPTSGELSLARTLPGRETAGTGKFEVASGVAEASVAVPASVDAVPALVGSASMALMEGTGPVDVAPGVAGLPEAAREAIPKGAGLSRVAKPTASAVLLKLAPAAVAGVVPSLVGLGGGFEVVASEFEAAGKGDGGADSEEGDDWEMAAPPGGVEAETVEAGLVARPPGGVDTALTVGGGDAAPLEGVAAVTGAVGAATAPGVDVRVCAAKSPAPV